MAAQTPLPLLDVGRHPDLPVTIQARSRTTRERILAATASCLDEFGYAGCSTSEISRRANVSQGTLFKHFGSKRALMVITAEFLLSGMVSSYRAAFAKLDPVGDRVVDTLALLAQTFQDRRLRGVFELYLAARTDETLRGALKPHLAAHRQAMHGLARTIFPDAAEQNPRFAAVTDLVLDAMQGRAVGNLVLPDPRGWQAELERLEELVRREVTDCRS
jgi:AcrR family transcriptional regulator